MYFHVWPTACDLQQVSPPTKPMHQAKSKEMTQYRTVIIYYLSLYMEKVQVNITV